MRVEDHLRAQQSFQTGTLQDSINQILQKYQQNQTTVTQHNTQLIKISFNNIQNIALKNKNINRKHKLTKNISITVSLPVWKPCCTRRRSSVRTWKASHSKEWVNFIWLPPFYTVPVLLQIVAGQQPIFDCRIFFKIYFVIISHAGLFVWHMQSHAHVLAHAQTYLHMLFVTRVKNHIQPKRSCSIKYSSFNPLFTFTSTIFE